MIHLVADETPVATAKQYIDHLKEERKMQGDFTAPEIVIVTFSNWHIEALNERLALEAAPFFHYLYHLDDRVGILGGFGIGAPALINRVEQLIACGTKRFILVGYAGSLIPGLNIGDYALCTHALSEDGVGHLYLKPGETIAAASPDLVREWEEYAHDKHLSFQKVMTWSFPILFRETKEAIERVTALGCSTVEMEVGGLYAIAQEKGVEALALFLISDELAGGVWKPKLQNGAVKEELIRLTTLAATFTQKRAP